MAQAILPAAGAGPKATHYHAQLTSALLAGAWTKTNPGVAPNGTELSWGELVRKWSKHTGGNGALIHHLRDISLVYLAAPSTCSSGFVTVSRAITAQQNPQNPPPAVQESTPGAAGASNSSEDTANSGSSFIHVPHPHLRRHKSRASTEVPSSGLRAAFTNVANLDGDDPADPSAWATGTHWWPGISHEYVDEAKDGIKALDSLITEGKLSPADLQSAKLILGYHLHALGQHEAALRVFAEVGDSNAKVGVVEGDAAVLERIRSLCLQGLSAELQQVPDPAFALQSYLSIAPLLLYLSSVTSIVPAYLSNSQRPGAPFDALREVHRWVSTALSRAAILSARQSSDVTQTLRILRTYHATSSSWPASFRPVQRQRMLQLYLRALQAGYPPASSTPAQPYLLDATVKAPAGLSARAIWDNEANDAMRQGMTLLAATTTFPKAGITNYQIIAFTDSCVALADTSPSLTQPAINVLWWSMYYTFQSQSVLRHLTRLLAAIGDTTEARRTFVLYVELVLKARQTLHPEGSLELKGGPDDDEPPTTSEPEGSEVEAVDQSDENGHAKLGHAEIDTDEEFVQALLVGSRLLLRDLGEANESWRYINLAGDAVVAARRARLRKELRAEVEECKGIIRMAMGSDGQGPLKRKTYQVQAIDHLKAATLLDPNSATAYYHLAFCHAEAREIELASDAIRRSLELDPRNVQGWHLLALVLSARNDWEAAAKAGEVGVSVWEGDEEAEAEGELVQEPGVVSKDTATGSTSNISPSSPLLLPNGSIALAQVHSRSPPTTVSRAKRLENVIRLRMTLNIISEKTQGPEVAMVRQQELFAFFSARSGPNREVTGNYSRGITGSFSLGDSRREGEEQGERDLGGSYVSVNADGQQEGVPQIFNITPSTPVESTKTVTEPALRRLGAPLENQSHSSISSQALSAGQSTPDTPAEPALKSSKKRLVNKRLAKHLHVPSQHSLRNSRPSSVRRLPVDELKTSATSTRDRSGSATSASIAPSIAPTAVHSHYRGSGSAPPPPAPPSHNRPPEDRTPSELRILSNLWLMSAATFRRWGKLEQCLVAIEEAEVLDPENADVWVQLGVYHTCTTPANVGEARASFTKAILLRPEHVPALVNVSKLYLTTGEVDLAHSILNQMSHSTGWDVAEVWFYLGKTCELQGRHERARELWRQALSLEETRPARRWTDGVDRWL